MSFSAVGTQVNDFNPSYGQDNYASAYSTGPTSSYSRRALHPHRPIAFQRTRLPVIQRRRRSPRRALRPTFSSAIVLRIHLLTSQS